ncbi:4'-phosphopantetheinyl transferase superfamily protein [uncultured Cellulomonas sp.]|uniref:4'-phosphopantetheinyl transferase family protein n=1 Tax=uncultured Cellulomonas sp. TaxID=189682 RepID=UPI002635E3B3|nr:hypothetical protein [uncultured Cellulomonas sp.]
MTRNKVGPGPSDVRRPEVEVWWSTLLAADHGLLDVLDATERDRVRSLSRPADQGRSMLAAALLRTAVGQCVGAPPAEVVLDRSCADCGRPHGRPRVVGPGRVRPHVSVSHSGLLVVVAVSAGAPVGVDVQRVADVAAAAGPAGGGAGSDAVGDRARAWVRREALVKAGDDGVAPGVLVLPTPLDGYVAALATLAARPLTEDDVVVRAWPPDPTPG